MGSRAARAMALAAGEQTHGRGSRPLAPLPSSCCEGELGLRCGERRGACQKKSTEEMATTKHLVFSLWIMFLELVPM